MTRRIQAFGTALIIPLVLFTLSCATGGKTGVGLEPAPGDRTVGREKIGKISAPRTAILGLTPERFNLFSGIDTDMMYRTQAAVIAGKLSLEEKVGQLFIISLWNGEKDSYSLTVGPEEQKRLKIIRPGGVILFGGNLDTEEQARKLASDIREESSIPPFIATDQEGGKIGRLYESGKIPATKLPAAGLLGNRGNPDYAYLAGFITGRETSSIGVNVVFAPVADIRYQNTHTVIGSRSFGEDPEGVAEMSMAFASGLAAGGVLPVIKHFPGHGGAQADPHINSSFDYRSLGDLRDDDLLPFKRAIAAGIDCVMISHVIMPNITGNDLPASCSYFIATELLREELGFTGISVSDSLAMGALRYRWEPEESVKKAVEAGIDCILEPPLPQSTFEAILEAVRDGRIGEQRIEESVIRILAVKLQEGIIPWNHAWGPDPKQWASGTYLRDHEALLESYLPGWEEFDREGIGNELHNRVNAILWNESE